VEEAQHAGCIRRLREQERDLTAAEARAEDTARAEPETGDYGDRALDDSLKDSSMREIDRDRQLLALVRDALAREAEGTYGLCVHCSQPIEPKRLEAVPWARHCIRCQDLEDRGLL
jgi:DnaK suppressor protein